MILGFKQQFVPKILDGTKIHTIREDTFNRWKPAKAIQFATGVRTKNYKQFKEDTCKSIQYIFMTYTQGIFEVSIGNTRYCDTYLMWNEIEKLAINDGFEKVEDFEKWFIPLIKKSEEHYYSGKIIHWTEKRY